MIAVAGMTAVAVILLSLLSMQAANERSRLVMLDRRLAETRRDYATLTTEFDIRSRPDLLLTWGDTSLALVPPRMHQYLAGFGQLQPLARPMPGTRADRVSH